MKTWKNAHLSRSFPDNRFVCDCRLAWMHTLRNETKNPRIKSTLEEMTCYMQQPGDGATLTPQNHENEEKFRDLGDYEEENYDNDLYEQQQDSSLLNEVKVRDPRRRQLFEIPVQELPCPQEEHPTEAPRTLLRTPGYAGINANASPKVFNGGGGVRLIFLFGVVFYFT